MDTVITLLVGILGTSAAWLIFFILIPEKLAKWAGILWGGFTWLGDFARKKQVQLEIEGRIGEFSRDIKEQAPFLDVAKPRIEWVAGEVEKKSFLDGGDVILRLRREDPHHHNFVHGVMLFVGSCLLPRTKRYLSQTQKLALDLFVTAQILDRQEIDVYTYFMDEYLFPKLNDPKSRVAILFEKYRKAHEGGLFFPIFIQELEFLGNKIFGKRNDDLIISEVNDLIDFLEDLSERIIGQETQLSFRRSYCNFFVVIVGKPQKIEKSIAPYSKYIRGELSTLAADSIYLVALMTNKQRVETLCKDLGDVLQFLTSSRSTATLNYDSGKRTVDQYIAVLRAMDASFIQK